MDRAATRGSVINKTRVSGKNDNFKGPLAATWPTWKSSKLGKVSSTGKWLNDCGMSLDRGRSLEVLHVKKSNTAAMSSTTQTRQEDIPLVSRVSNIPTLSALSLSVDSNIHY